MTNQEIKINQTLHGYSNGHRLIKSSIKLSKEVERALLFMSDMSGPSMLKGFEEYISGYPINDKLYALAKTWYAPEMKRPGCVWTHTLLINLTDLSKIKDFQALVQLFGHPKKSDSHITYGSSINLGSKDYFYQNHNLDTHSNKSKLVAMKILEGLYTHPEEPVYILSDDSKQYENLIIKIWSQQWPELRRTFYFCTGSISNRNLNNKVFDLQVIPFKNENQVNREVAKGIYLAWESENLSNENIGWLSTSVADLFDRNNIRNLLWQFAINSKGGRKSYAGYFEIIDLLNKTRSDKSSISYLTKRVCSLFPSPNDAINLKTTIYGHYKNNIDISTNMLNEHLVLKELLTTKHHNSFNLESLNISERAKDLWKYSKRETQQLISEIITLNLNPLGEAFLYEISALLEPYDLTHFDSENAALFHVFLNINPSLAASHVIWEQSNINFNNLLEAVSKSKNLTKTVVRDINNAILQSHMHIVANDLVRTFGEIAIYSYLDWLDKDSSFINLSDKKYYEWKNVLSNNISAVIKWLSRSKKATYNTLRTLCNILDPNSSDVVSLGSSIWMPLVKSNKNLINNIEIKSFLLALGFNNPDNRAEELVRISFEEVHDTIEKSSREDRVWYLIEQNVPSLSWWMNWDKCERLRRALVDKFIQYNWSAQEFLLSVSNDKTFFRIVQYCKSDKTSKQFIKSIKDKVVHGEISAKKSQMDILVDNIN